MAQVISDYLFGVDSRIKSKSSKPISHTMQDAIIVSIVSMIISIIILIAYNYIFEKTVTIPDHEFWLAAAQGFAVSMVTQFLYEYIGINSMIAESSIRYAKGSVLQKYKSHRSAVLYECLYKLLSNLDKVKSNLDDPSIDIQFNEIKRRFKILKILTLYPEIITQSGELKLDLKLTPSMKQKAQLVRSVDTKHLAAIQIITMHINDALIYDILYNGFTNYTTGDNLVKKYIAVEVNPTQLKEGTARGEAIMQIIEENDL